MTLDHRFDSQAAAALIAKHQAEFTNYLRLAARQAIFDIISHEEHGWYPGTSLVSPPTSLLPKPPIKAT